MKTKTTIAALAAAAILAAGCGETKIAAPSADSPAVQTEQPQSEQTPPVTEAPAEETPVEDGVFKYGAAASSGTLDISVYKPITGYDTLFEESYQAVRVKACANQTGESINPYDFKAMYSGSELADPGIGVKEPALHDTTLRAGECAAGWVTFDGKRPIKGVRYESYDANFDPVIASWEKGA